MVVWRLVVFVVVGEEKKSGRKERERFILFY